jgi:hypothetical protein
MKAVICISLLMMACHKPVREIYFQNFDHDSLKTDLQPCSGQAFSGNQQVCTGTDKEFSYTITFPVSDLKNKGFYKARVSAMVKKKRHDSDGRLVVSLEPVFNNRYYLESHLKYKAPLAGKWYEVKEVMIFPDSIPEGTLLKVYLWSPQKTVNYMDNLRIEFLGW